MLVIISLPFPFPFIYITICSVVGFTYGYLWGIAVVMIGTALGMVISYCLLHYFCFHSIASFVSTRPKLLDYRTILENSKNGFAVLFLIRMTPITLGLQNGLLMFSSKPWYIVFPVSYLGLVPNQVLFIVIGDRLQHFSLKEISSLPTMELVGLLMPIISMVLVIFIFIWYARKRIRVMVQVNPQNAINVNSRQDQNVEQICIGPPIPQMMSGRD